jgi:hypothetical protein
VNETLTKPVTSGPAIGVETLIALQPFIPPDRYFLEQHSAPKVVQAGPISAALLDLAGPPGPGLVRFFSGLSALKSYSP